MNALWKASARRILRLSFVSGCPSAPAAEREATRNKPMTQENFDGEETVEVPIALRWARCGTERQFLSRRVAC
jgi:hypothetical protein